MSPFTNVSQNSQCQDSKLCATNQNASKKCSKSLNETFLESRTSDRLPSNSFKRSNVAKNSSIVKNQISSFSSFDKPKYSQITFVTNEASSITNSEFEFTCNEENEETSKEPDCENEESSSVTLGQSKNKIEMKIKTNIV